MEKVDYIIDIQGFQDKNSSFIPKEIAVLAVECNHFSHWIVKSPYDCTELPKSVLATNSYLTCFHHGIEWFDGESNLEDVYNALREVARGALRIYVRGIQKQQLLEQVLGRQILNLEDFDCPTFKNLPRVNEHFCSYHGRKREYFSCAIAYTYKLRLWLVKTIYASPDDDTEILDISSNEHKKKNRISLSKKTNDPAPPNRQSTYGVAAAAPPAKPPRGGKKNDKKKEHIYDTVDYELPANSASAQPCTSTDCRCFSGGQNTVRLGSTVCTCS